MPSIVPGDHDVARDDGDLIRVFAALGLTTASVRMLPLLRQVRRAAAASDVPLLLEGETGTGKLVIAQAVHHLDRKRGPHPFVTVHCASIQQTVAESELFGHERGAFSGAVDERKGLFRAAHRGTLFLDDVGDLPAALQPKLLDVLQRRVVRSLGADREYPVDVRVIAATNEPLERLVAESRFRADLYYRLDVVRLRIPPLRDRRDDLARLVLALAQRYADLYGPIDAVDVELVRALEQRPFPGNVRELEHLVERMLFAKTSGTTLTIADLPPEPDDHASAEGAFDAAADALWRAIERGHSGYDDALRRVESRILAAARDAPGRTRRDVATALRISERSLYKKLRALRAVASSSVRLD